MVEDAPQRRGAGAQLRARGIGRPLGAARGAQVLTRERRGIVLDRDVLDQGVDTGHPRPVRPRDRHGADLDPSPPLTARVGQPQQALADRRAGAQGDGRGLVLIGERRPVLPHGTATTQRPERRPGVGVPAAPEHPTGGGVGRDHGTLGVLIEDPEGGRVEQ